MICPNCASSEIRRSQRSSWTDVVQQFRGQDAFRCRKCRNRFYAPRAAVTDPKAIKPSRRRRSGGKANLKKRLKFIGTLSLVIGAGVVTLLWLVQMVIGTKPPPPFDPKDAVAEFVSSTWAFPAYTGPFAQAGRNRFNDRIQRWRARRVQNCRADSFSCCPVTYVLTYAYRTAGTQ